MVMDPLVTVPEVNETGGRQTSALEEADMVAEWAEPTTPEWVRCMGALWEASIPFEPNDAATLKDGYRALLQQMLTSDPRAPAWARADPEKMVSRRLDDLDVVIRQLRQRSYFLAAAFAAVVGTEVFPSESWVFSIAGNCSRQAGDLQSGMRFDRRCAELLEAAGSNDAPAAWRRYAHAAFLVSDLDDDTLAFALKKFGASDELARAVLAPSAAAPISLAEDLSLQLVRLRRLAAIDPDGAIAEGLVLFEVLAKEGRTLAETSEGHALIELLLGALTERNDARAIRVAQTILDEKLALWGECPAAWMERQNLGGVLAQLGEVEQGRGLVEDARARLAQEFGDDHPHVTMCDRNLARIAARAS